MRIICLLVLAIVVPSSCFGQSKLEQEPIKYSESEPTDSVFSLDKKIESGEVELEWDAEHGYLKSLLKHLKIPHNSQSLVFSKTSLQVSRITPQTPRAIYFNDDVYVGWVQNGDVIEISAADPKLGGTFYTIKQKQSEKARITRETSRCLQCHGSTHTRGRPGHMVRSVYPNETGMPEYALGTHLTAPDSEFKERFGGWFVTGTHGDLRHMGNSWMPKSTKTGYQRFQRDPSEFDTEKGANLKTLEGLIDVKPYLDKHSDIVAQLVLQHQVYMHNVITEANFSGRMAAYDAKTMNKIFEREAGHESESTLRRYDSAAEKVVKALLFCDEVQLASPVKGSNSFQEEFVTIGPRDVQGRGLREFDLKDRVFKYPCSFLIYSDAFKGLPDGVKSRVLKRLGEVLSGKDESSDFEHLSDEDRKAVLEILTNTGVEIPVEG